jgi:ACS family glucarate transporter-like MFS transporter
MTARSSKPAGTSSVSSASSAKPTHTRWIILALLFLISVITYIDRVNISVTARQMMPALGLTEVQMGQVFSAFVLGYALFQIPGGWLGDQWGPRRVLTLAVIWWSLFTVLTAVAAVLPLADLIGVLGSLVCVRFLIGVGEAAALPNFNRAVANWLRPRERGLGIGIAIGGIGVGSALAPPATAWLMVNYGWQSAFYVAGGLGLLIAAFWFSYATDRPAQHPHVNAAEAVLIQAGTAPGRTGEAGPVPWRAIARTPTLWWLVGSYTCLGYVAYIYMSWFYLYLVNVRGFSILRGAFFASAPFVAITILCPLGGWVTDRLVQALGVNRGRAYVGGLGMALAAIAILMGSFIEAPLVAIALLSLGAGFLYFTVGAYWNSTVDLSKRHAGTLSGLMNTGANVGGSLSPTLTPWLADQLGWSTALSAAAAIALLGGLMWIKIRPGEGLRTVAK